MASWASGPLTTLPPPPPPFTNLGERESSPPVPRTDFFSFRLLEGMVGGAGSTLFSLPPMSLSTLVRRALKSFQVGPRVIVWSLSSCHFLGSVARLEIPPPLPPLSCRLLPSPLGSAARAGWSPHQPFRYLQLCPRILGSCMIFEFCPGQMQLPRWLADHSPRFQTI